LENKVPLSLVVRKLNVICESDARNPCINESEGFEVILELKGPTVRNPSAEVMRHHVQRCAQRGNELMKDLADVFRCRWAGQDSRVPKTRQVSRYDFEFL
jgi:hypothetical protein